MSPGIFRIVPDLSQELAPHGTRLIHCRGDRRFSRHVAEGLKCGKQRRSNGPVNRADSLSELLPYWRLPRASIAKPYRSLCNCTCASQANAEKGHNQQAREFRRHGRVSSVQEILLLHGSASRITLPRALIGKYGPNITKTPWEVNGVLARVRMRRYQTNQFAVGTAPIMAALVPSLGPKQRGLLFSLH